MTPIDQYKRSFHQPLRARARTPQQTVIDIHTWYTSGGRGNFINTFKAETGLTLTVNRSDTALVTQGYPKNVNEYNTRAKWDQYYVANGLIALCELDKVFGVITPVPTTEPDIFYVNIAHLVQRLILDTMVLIDDWATFGQQMPGMMGIGKNRHEHAFAIYHSARQIIYGNLSRFAPADNHSDTSTNQLRMAIEVRLRRGFGIIAKLNKTGAIVPLALSDIITGIRKHVAQITFAVPLDHIERLYGWANIYVHSGLKQYTWSPIWALDYLRPFVLGGTYKTGKKQGTSVNAGIRAEYGVVRQVQAAVESGIDKTRFTLLIEDPRSCDLILR